VHRTVNHRFTLALMLALPWQGASASEYYAIDPVHTRVAFHVMHAGFSPSIGTVSKPTGHIWFDEKDPGASSVEIRIPVDTLDMGDAAWNRKVAESFLNTGAFPTASFQSTAVRVSSLSPLLLGVHGELRIAGGSIPFPITSTLSARTATPCPFNKALGLQASTQFSRKALGIDAWSSVVDDTVYMEVAVEAIRTVAPDQKDIP